MAETTHETVRRLLKECGLRYSRPREAILGYFAEGDRHVSAEDLYVTLKGRGQDLSLSTVYLNLNVLRDAGVVREFQGENGQKLYDSNVDPHYHLICRETGEVVDVPAPTVDGMPLDQYLRRTIERVTGWRVEEAHVQLRGVSPRAEANPEGEGADVAEDAERVEADPAPKR